MQWNAEDAAAVLELIRAARVVFDRADWNGPEMRDLREALKGVAGFDFAALVVPTEPPGDTAGSGAASLTQGGFAEALVLPRDFGGVE